MEAHRRPQASSGTYYLTAGRPFVSACDGVRWNRRLEERFEMVRDGVSHADRTRFYSIQK
jgi:hypothetical protein